MDSRICLSTLQSTYWKIKLKIFFKHLKALCKEHPFKWRHRSSPEEKKTLTMPNEDKCLAISAKEPLICTDYSKINRHTAVLHVALFNGGTRRQKTDGE